VAAPPLARLVGVVLPPEPQLELLLEIPLS
jgi:hypothetical protein